MRSPSGLPGQTLDLDGAAQAASTPPALRAPAARLWRRARRRLFAEMTLLAADTAVALATIAMVQMLCARLPSPYALRAIGAVPLWPYDPLLVALILIPLLFPPATFSRALFAPRRLIVGAVLAGLTLAAAAYFFGLALPRLYVPVAVLTALLALGICRVLSRWAVASIPAWQLRVLLLGADVPTEIIGRLLFHYRRQGVVVVSQRAGSAAEPLSLDDLAQDVASLDIDDVIISRGWYARVCGTLEGAIRMIERVPARIYLAPDEAGLALAAPSQTAGGLPLVRLAPLPISAWQLAVKRGLDVLAALIALVICGLPLLLIAAAIRLSSPGPVIYRQLRVGRYGRLFTIYKFRTMRVVLPVGTGEGTAGSAADEATHKLREDPRITRVGAFLRRSSLDELPQLFNVLNGDMSLVGPRPELPEIVKLYEPWQHVRLLLPQGLTGWWQVNGRGERLMRQHTEDDLYYVRNFSLLLDVRILLMTVKAVITGRGAF